MSTLQRATRINRRQASTGIVLAGLGVLAAEWGAHAQDSPNRTPPTSPAQVERLSASSLRVGNVQVDTARKEVSVRGVVTDANVLEFVAVTKGGQKAYESAIELDTNAINFNLGMILIGLDQSRSVVPKMHLDPTQPKGDPVEVFVEWDGAAGRRRIRAEELIFNIDSKRTLPVGPWVYTGSVFLKESNAYLADVEGSLIGFVHTPATVIDSPRPLASGGSYGNDVINPSLGLKAGTAVTVIVRALPRGN